MSTAATRPSPLTSSITQIMSEARSIKTETPTKLQLCAASKPNLPTPSVVKFDSPPSPKKRKTAHPRPPCRSTGRWTPEEHRAFLEGLSLHGREWKKVAEKITTRTSAQIRSHAQKYFARLAKKDDDEVGTTAPTINISTNASTVPLLLSNNENLMSCDDSDIVPYVITPSTMQKVEQILSDPHSVEEQVTSTLLALQNRYRQLQIRVEARRYEKIVLREQQRRRRQQPRPPPPIVVVPDCLENAVVGPATAALEREQQKEKKGRGRKRQCIDLDDFDGMTGRRELGMEEIIALQVLGGGLTPVVSDQSLMNDECLGDYV